MRGNVEEILECQAMCLDNYVIHCASMDITVPEEFSWKSLAMTLVVLGHAEGNKWVQERFQHSGETVHRHVTTVVKLLATVMVPDIIKPADRTFQDVPEHIQHSSRYWPHLKVLSEFGLFT